MSRDVKLAGLLAEFREPDELLRAVRRAREAGYVRMEAYSPYPVEGLADALGFTRTRIPHVVLVGGLVGAALGFLLQYWVSVHAYPLNIGGKPLNSWPSFIPVTFETTVLLASLAAVLGMLGLNGLPRPHHPLFAIKSFERATQDRFFLFILFRDPKFDPDETRKFLEELSDEEVRDVPL